MDRLVHVSLLGSTADTPYRIGELKQNIQVSPQSPNLRTDSIRESLHRLIDEGLARHTEKRTRHAYYLTQAGYENLEKSESSVRELLTPVLESMLEDLDGAIDLSVAESIFRSFISRCFASYGYTIAKYVTGRISKSELMGMAGFDHAFHDAISDHHLSDEVTDSLRARCMAFLKSNDKKQEELKFRLTQGFYVTQLLGIDASKFNPVSKEAFANATLYLDTNTVIPKLLGSPENNYLDELTVLSRGIGVDLVVTQATLDEADDVVVRELDDLDRVVGSDLPTALLDASRDEFLQSYLRGVEAEEVSTVDEFRARFDNIPDTLTGIGITIDARTAEELCKGRDVTEEMQTIDSSAIGSRGWGKSPDVQRHDVAHYVEVEEVRKRGDNAWFLTQDRTLAVAAVELSGDGLPFSMPVIGFLQAISPFVEGTGNENALMDIFSHALSSDAGAISNGSVFDLQELRLISEMHEDVLSTEPDRVVLALDYVKSKVLKGRQYRHDDHPKFALELKKFLSSSAEEQKEEYKRELRRLREARLEDQRKREDAEKEAERSETRVTDLEDRVGEIEIQLASAHDEIQSKNVHILGFKAAVFIIGAFLSLVLWVSGSIIEAALSNEPDVVSNGLNLIIPFIASAIFFGSSLPLCLHFEKQLSITFLTISGAIAAAGLPIFGAEMIGVVSNYVGVAAILAVIVYVVREYMSQE